MSFNNRRVYIGGSNASWPIKDIKTSDGKALNSYALLVSPPRTKVDNNHILNALNRGCKLIGLSAYQNFPQRTVGPNIGTIENNFALWEELGTHIKGWLYCAQNGERMLPNGLPKIMMSNSDFTNPNRIQPHKVDKITFDQHKKYDFVYVCRESLWNEYCRNWHTGARCVKKLAQAGYTIAVIGHDSKREFTANSRIDLKPTLDWHTFLATIRSSRCLLVPNIYDASPRIIAEALCLDVPILVNKHIFGGWKYVNARTGRFFSTDEHIVEIASTLLLDQSLAPRAYFQQYYGHKNAGRALYKFIQHIDRLE